MAELLLLPKEEQARRLDEIARMMCEASVDLSIICDNAMIYYLTGRVVSGWILVDCEGRAVVFVKRPVDMQGKRVAIVRKPEDIPALMPTFDFCHDFSPVHATVGFEMSTLRVSDYNRLRALFPGARHVDISPIERRVRSVKSPYEVTLIEASGLKQEQVYRLIPSLYKPGMTDIELQIEIERQLRLAGCLGQFRVSGDQMELFMGNILVGDNADNATPYDFAMGGAGADPSLPVGANGSVIAPGQAVMVDANGNFTGYMTDMTRTFSLGKLPAEALIAHQCSIDICEALAAAALPGTRASDLYEQARSMASDAGLADYFMGHKQKAGFVGHGVGIEINEAPVIAPRSRDVIALGNVIALEPKFVMPGVGAVGVENTYVAEERGLRCLTNAPVEIIPF